MSLKSVTLPNSDVITYKVDGLNRRVKKILNGNVVEYYLWYDQIRLAAVLDANKAPKLIYIYGPESQHSPSFVIKNSVSYRILHDPGLGSIRYIVEPSSREIVQAITYDEYGNMMTNTDPTFQPLTFAGGLYDADTKLIRFGARDYDPVVGRWTTKDPSGFNGGTTNLYEYGHSNPMSYIDPDGNIAIPALLFAGYFFYGSLTDTAGQGAWEQERIGDAAMFFGAGGIQGASIKEIPGFTGYTKHGLNRLIGDGTGRSGVSPSSYLNTIRNPSSVLRQSDGSMKFKGSTSTVVLTPEGKIRTAWPTNSCGVRGGK